MPETCEAARKLHVEAHRIIGAFGTNEYTEIFLQQVLLLYTQIDTTIAARDEIKRRTAGTSDAEWLAVLHRDTHPVCPPPAPRPASYAAKPSAEQNDG
jgi:hypothetical protein